MAATLNKVLLMGNLTRDPNVKRSPGGDTVADLGLAVSEQFRSKSTGETREVVTFVDVTVWGKVAENCGKYLSKGRPVFIEGRLVLDTWEDKATGQKRSRLRVRADRVQFLSAPAPKAPGEAQPIEAAKGNASGGDAASPSHDAARRASNQPTAPQDGFTDEYPF